MSSACTEKLSRVVLKEQLSERLQTGFVSIHFIAYALFPPSPIIQAGFQNQSDIYPVQIHLLFKLLKENGMVTIIMWRKVLLHNEREANKGKKKCKATKFLPAWKYICLTDCALCKIPASGYLLSTDTSTHPTTSMHSLLPNHAVSADSMLELFCKDWHSAEQTPSVFCQCWSTCYPVLQFVSRLKHGKNWNVPCNPLLMIFYQY